MQISIPKFEPEVIQAAAKKNCEDFQKVPTTAIDHFFFRGIYLRSLYRKAHEFELMCGIIEEIGETYSKYVKMMLCDSRLGDRYLITLAQCTEDVANQISARFETVCIAKLDGHSGIYFTCPDHWYVDRHGISKNRNLRAGTE
jgi:hypothetical protein